MTRNENNNHAEWGQKLKDGRDRRDRNYYNYYNFRDGIAQLRELIILIILISVKKNTNFCQKNIIAAGFQIRLSAGEIIRLHK